MLKLNTMLKATTVKVGLAVVLAGISFNSYAVTTRVWQETSQNQFDQGELEGVSTTSEGDILLGRVAKKVGDADEVYVWSLVTDSEGNLFAGTGNQGKIFKIDATGKTSLLYDSPELEVQSLAVDEKGNIYAGTSPKGIIYRLSPDGKATEFCDLEDYHIWSLAFDSMGNLYAGTGDKGKIYRITSHGKPKLIYDSNQTHILCMVKDSEDNLYAGSEPDGIVYKITPEGKISVLYDAREGEIHALALDGNNNLFAGTAAGGMAAQAQMTGAQPRQQQPPHKMAAKAVGNSVYRITPDGMVNQIFTSAKYLILSIAPDENGNIYVGTGNEGMIYKISAKGSTDTDEEIRTLEVITTLLKSENLQILSMHWKDAKLYFGTGNMGCIYSLADRYSKDGVFTSRVFDTSLRSRWGNIFWKEALPEKTQIFLSTRSGNTQKPDNTWSEWSKAYADSSGEKIESPPGRFIQYKAQLKSEVESKTAILHEVNICYLRTNQPPEMQSVMVEGYRWQGKAVLYPPSTKESKVKVEKGEKMAIWQAKDPNGDSLSYDIYYRGETEKKWKELETDIEKTSRRWDTVTFPDGYYLLKIVASDSPNNPPDKAKTAQKISEPFLVDNTPSKVEDLEVQLGPEECIISGVAQDDTSKIITIEYSVDAEDWVNIFPTDDIFDSKKELFQFTVLPETDGEHTVVVKATDSQGNVGTGKVVFETE